MEQAEEVTRLEGMPVLAVYFVQDYVELFFGGPVLRALAEPVIEARGHVWRFPDTGSRDALCELIGATVVHVAVETDVAIRLEFDSGQKFTIPLDTDPPGVESAHFVDQKNDVLRIW